MTETDIVCAKCGRSDDIQTHHMQYVPPITQCLCVDCHKMLHNHSVGRAGLTRQRHFEGEQEYYECPQIRADGSVHWSNALLEKSGLVNGDNVLVSTETSSKRIVIERLKRGAM